MKTFSKFLVMAAAVLAVSPVMAQQYGTPTTLLSIGGTNATATATNVGAVATNGVTLTKYQDFDLEITLGATNACAGTYDVTWTTSDDGVNWVSSPAAPGASGWFSVPCTNGGTTIIWRTNITVNTAGYWRAGWATNATGQSLTNQRVRAYVKPKRFGP